MAVAAAGLDIASDGPHGCDGRLELAPKEDLQASGRGGCFVRPSQGATGIRALDSVLPFGQVVLVLGARVVERSLGSEGPAVLEAPPYACFSRGSG